MPKSNGAKQAVAPGEWTTGFCDCFSDCETLCCTFWCPCVQVGRNAELASGGYQDGTGACCIYFLVQSCIGCGCLYSFGFRTKLRQMYNLPAKPCDDCCAHFFCTCCAVSQEGRELKNRGWELAKGYKTNVERMQAKGQPGPQAMGR